MEHVPILVNEILGFLKEMPMNDYEYLDGTFGRGGHLRAVFNAFPAIRATALDKDLDAIAYANKTFASEISTQKLQVVHSDYANLKEQILNGKVKAGQFDAILLDLGVSSPQFDTASRGFSFIHDGPLDMRMDRSQTLTAKEVVNTWAPEELQEMFRKFGEVERPGRVIRAIVTDREKAPFETTHQLAGLIERVDGWKKKGVHPATQYFMALRIQVNNELEPLETALKDCIDLLKPRGRLMVITFHSLEDRIVKNVFLSSQVGQPIVKRVITPSETEQKQNPRSRSAKLRVFEKTGKSFEREKKNKYADKKGH